MMSGRFESVVLAFQMLVRALAQATETTLALLVVVDRFQQVNAAEVRP